MATKQINYSDNDRLIVATLKGTEGLTLAEINEANSSSIKPGTMTSAINKGLIAKVGEREVFKPYIKEVGTYVLASTEHFAKEDGKPYNYSETEDQILNAMEADHAYTLAELSEVLGRTLSSGSINGLVKKANIVKGEPVEREAQRKSVVSVYGYVADVPTQE